jgi:hypothetical protein
MRVLHVCVLRVLHVCVLRVQHVCVLRVQHVCVASSLAEISQRQTREPLLRVPVRNGRHINLYRCI